MNIDKRIAINNKIVAVDTALEQFLTEDNFPEVNELEDNARLCALMRRLQEVVADLCDDDDYSIDSDNFSALDSTYTLMGIYETLLGVPLLDAIKRSGAIDLKESFNRINALNDTKPVENLRDNLYRKISARLNVPQDRLNRRQLVRLGMLNNQFSIIHGNGRMSWQQFQEKLGRRFQ